MKVSQKKLDELYYALEHNITNLRIEVSRADSQRKPLTPKEIDEKLYQLEQTVWEAQKKALNGTTYFRVDRGKGTQG